MSRKLIVSFFFLLPSVSSSCPNNTLKVLSLMLLSGSFREIFALMLFLSLPLSMGIISTSLKMSESSGMLEALLFIYARRVKLIPYMYLVITDLRKNYVEKMKKGKLRHYNRSPEANQFLRDASQKTKVRSYLCMFDLMHGAPVIAFANCFSLGVVFIRRV